MFIVKILVIFLAIVSIVSAYFSGYALRQCGIVRHCVFSPTNPKVIAARKFVERFGGLERAEAKGKTGVKFFTVQTLVLLFVLIVWLVLFR